MSQRIQVYEWERLYVDKVYGGVTFLQTHLDALHRYKVQQENVNFYEPLYNQVRFNQYVGVLKIGNLTIEVLPKPDRYEDDKNLWQNVLLNMLLISLQLEAKTTTRAEISIRQHSVLETYLQLFLKEVDKLIHRGLVKKYRSEVGNQTALKGKLLIHQQATKNAVHSERFYVSFVKYDQDNIYNFIIKAALECIVKIGSESFRKAADSFLLLFPECNPHKLDENLFQRLVYDRKTEGYKTAIELARLIILNYHPDIKGGKDDILAIMFDMNLLWEKFIFWSLRNAVNRGYPHLKVKEQVSKKFWHGNNRTISLKPDIVIENSENGENIVIDTKWKYQSKTSVEDVRQLYTYGHYYYADKNYLLYPDQLEEQCKIVEGNYYDPNSPGHLEHRCGLLFVDVVRGNKLNYNLGRVIMGTII